MKKTVLFLALVALFLAQTAFTQTSAVTLSGIQYLETFDNLANGLPTGWGIKTGATSNTLAGTDATLTTTATLWNNTSGRFNNYASGNIGATGDQTAATDRALGVRQTGTVGDPGAAFVVKLVNTAGFSNFQLSFKIQSLDATSPRSVNWLIEYGLGDAPTTYTALTTTPATLTTGNSVFSNTTVTATFASALDNLSSAVWIRIRTAGASTGSGNRPSTAIDDFKLTYATASNDPAILVSADTLKNFLTNEGIPSSAKTYTVSGINLSGDLVVKAPAAYEISTQSATGYTNTVTFAPVNKNVASTTVYVRLKGTAQGTFSGNITHESAGITTKNVALDGKVNPPALNTTIANAKTLEDNRTVIVQGRLTVTSQYGGKLVYIQDATGGLAVFANNAATYPANWQIGDSVQVLGNMATFNGKREIIDPPSVTLVTGAANKAVTPKVVAPDKLSENEGLLVTVENANYITTGNFAANTNYQAANCEGVFMTVRINSSANPFATTAIPTNTRNVTGIVELFNGAFQLMPRLADDMPVAAKQCTITTTCNTTATLIPDNGTSRNASFDLVAWNLDWFGHTGSGFGPANDTLQQNNQNCVVSKFNTDVIALEEVCDTAKLSKILPVGFKYKCSTQYYSHFFDSPETPADPAQKVCVAYNAQTVTPIEAECKNLLTDKAVFTTSSPTNNFWASGRLPYMFTANVSVDGTTQKVRIVVIHAKAGSAIEDYNRRLSDVQALKAEIDAKYPTDNVIITGDFNDDVDTSIAVGNASPYADFVKDSTRYKALTKELSAAGKKSTASFTEMIDHIVVSNEMASAYISGSVGVGTAASTSFIGSYSSTTTDHYPVWASFNLKKVSVKVKDLKNTGMGIKTLFPVPTNAIINVQYTLDRKSVLEVKNLMGQTLFTKTVVPTEGVTTEAIDVSNYPSSVYFVSLSNELGISTQHFIKQ